MINDELLHKWVHGELSGDELAEFKKRPEYESLVELYRQTEDLEGPELEADVMLQEILKAKRSAGEGRRVFLTTVVKYAAAAIVLLVAGWFLLMQSADVQQYATAKGEQVKSLLPDGSAFTLNAESKLEFDAGAWESKRSLDLEGEAFFDVQKGSVFTVRTPNGSVQVLGTQFNVWSRGATLDVQCREGRVAVYNESGTRLADLSANDALRLTPGQDPERYLIASTEHAGWTVGITRLRQVALATALEELERQFDIDIQSQGIDLQQVISCNFQHDDLELALKTVLGPLGVEYEIGDGEVRVGE